MYFDKKIFLIGCDHYGKCVFTSTESIFEGQPQPPTARLAEMRLSAGGEGPLSIVKPGTSGRQIVIETNHLALNLGNYPNVIHYDVAFIPEAPKKLFRPALEEFRRKHFPKRHPAFDGRKNMYSVGFLPFGEILSDQITATDEEGGKKEFNITVKYANTIDLGVLKDPRNPLAVIQNAVQCVDIVLRSAPVNYCIPVGRSFFTQPEKILKLGNGMEMYHGFYQTAIRGWKMLLNVDVAHKAFPTVQPVIEAVVEVIDDYRHSVTRESLQRTQLYANQIEKIEKFLRTLKVQYEIPRMPSSKRVHRINGLGQPASRAQFTSDGQTMTVKDYFSRQKNYKLQYPDLPTLWVGNRDRPDKVLLPMELCTILPNQAVNRKMTEDQTSAMIKLAATSTTIRKEKIVSSVTRANYNSNAVVKEFGFNVGTSFEKVPARVLDPPTLGYNSKNPVRVSKGVWRADREQFLRPAQLKGEWTIVSADRPISDREVGDFVQLVKNLTRQNGMNIHQDPLRPYQHIRPANGPEPYKAVFEKLGHLALIFVIVPNSGPVYAYVKSAAELRVGCLTQCIKTRTLGRINPQTVGNILLKVNSKLDGLNHRLYQPPQLLGRPVMIMGADVTHPSPDAKNIPSVAAVTASHDPQAFGYNICWRLQPPKVEIISDLQAITREHLLYFYKRNKQCKPERLIFFRDGVSEGQFDQVRYSEIAAIQAACTGLSPDYQPKITFLVVQKRHHTRFFPFDKRDTDGDRNFNVPAGTIVDREITNPIMQDFYLVSHASIQGVAKPTKYCTLYDDSNFDHDTIEQLTYHLCHMFARCNRSVSYPAPTYYAHLAAARAKAYIENVNLDMDNLRREQEKFQILDVIRKEKPMFFI